MKFIHFILDAKNHAWAAENIDYKVPNKPAMESLSPDFLKQFPNMAMPVSELVGYELSATSARPARLRQGRDGDQGGELRERVVAPSLLPASTPPSP